MMSMDVSPAPMPPMPRSLGGTPVSHHKRMRDDDEYIERLVEQHVEKSGGATAQSLDWCGLGSPARTPQHSPAVEGSHATLSSKHPSGAMCLTPMAGFATDDASLAGGMGIRWGVQQRQGPRSSQEDCVACKVEERGFVHACFGVFDGHGGSAASEHAADHLHRHVLNSVHFPSDVLSAMQDGFLRTDAELLRRAAAPPRRKDDNCGTAAAVCIVTSDGIAVAHAGDCRAILIKRSGAAASFVPLTHDHSAERIPAPDGPPGALTDDYVRPDEVVRVQRVGGRMDAGGYVRATQPPCTAAAVMRRSSCRFFFAIFFRALAQAWSCDGDSHAPMRDGPPPA